MPIPSKMLYKVILLSFTLSLLMLRLGLAQITSIKDLSQEYSLDTRMSIFIDSSRQTGFEDIQKEEFQKKFLPNTKENPAFGYFKYNIWVKVSIKNDSPSERDWVLKYDWVLLDTIYVYQKVNNAWKYDRMGLGVRFDERPMPYIITGVPIVLPKDSVSTFYVHITSRKPTAINLSVLQKDVFTSEQYYRNLMYGLYFGSLLVMMLYNIFIWIFLKDKSYLYYIFTIFCTISIFSTVSGYSGRYLWPDYPEINLYYGKIMMCGIVIGTSLFTNSFLDTRKNAPVFLYLFRLSMALAVLGIIFIFAYKSATQFENDLLKFHTLLLLSSGIWIWSRGQKVARFYVLAWVSYFVGGIGITYSNTGHLPINFFTRHGVEIGSVLEVVLLSLALSDRYRIFKKEKEEAIEELLRIEKQTTEELEEKVRIRTQEQAETNEELKQANEELNITIEVVNKQKIDIEKQQDQILSSINYARSIQKAILPRKEDMDAILQEYFVLFKPKDVVSGDFYYCIERDNKIIVAAIDCTGHGVPGAFMSLIANDLLTEIVVNRKILEVDIVLNKMHKGIRRILRQKENNNKDGMDLSLIIIDKAQKTLDFAGAHNHLIYIQDHQLYQIKGDRKAIGGEQREQDRIFTKHQIKLDQVSCFYMFSDGYQDQFGGPHRKKFMIKQLKELLLNIYQEDLPTQKNILNQTIEDWKKASDENQIDDILVLGLKINPDKL